MNRKTTDFSEILETLRKWGKNDYEMAKLTGVNRTSLTKLRQGTRKQPNYDDGVAIMGVFESAKKEKQ